MRTLRWLRGLVRRRPAELVVAGVSIAVTVAFVASLGAFVTQSHAALTERAAASVPVDWQVQVTPQGDVTGVLKELRRLPDLRAVEQVSFAHVRALSSTGANGTRVTGAAYVVVENALRHTPDDGTIRVDVARSSATDGSSSTCATPGSRSPANSLPTCSTPGSAVATPAWRAGSVSGWLARRHVTPAGTSSSSTVMPVRRDSGSP